MPPFIGVAVKVTELPGQNGLADAPMVIPTGRLALTIIVIKFDVEGLPVGQAMLEVRMQDTRSPDAGL